MKKILYLFILLVFVSCYQEKDSATNPNHPDEYLGVWKNEITTINGVIDDIYPLNKVPHYNFGIAQSEVTLSTSSTLGSEYQNWKIDKTTSPNTLVLYKESPTTIPDMVFKITKEPTMGKMEITYTNNIVYFLTK